MNATTPRRGFVGRIGAALLALTTLSPEAKALEPAPDESWLQGLIGKHRQLFDVNLSKDGRSLGRLANYLDAYVEAYELKDSEINAVFGMHGNGLPIALNDAMW